MLMCFINIPHLVESPVSCRIYWGKVREVLDIPLPDEPVKDNQQYSVLIELAGDLSLNIRVMC